MDHDYVSLDDGQVEMTLAECPLVLPVFWYIEGRSRTPRQYLCTVGATLLLWDTVQGSGFLLLATRTIVAMFVIIA